MEDRRLYKLESFALFKKHGLPILEYEVLAEDRFEDQARNFMARIDTSSFMVRTDGKGKFSPSINDATLEKDTETIREFFRNGHTVFAMHPARLHTNFCVVNVMKMGDDVILEAVGPGFIAGDMNKRGEMHEEITLDYPELKISKRLIISPEKFQESVSRKKKSYSESELNASGSFLLKYPEYVPMAPRFLRYIRENLYKMEAMARDMGSENFITSLSFIDLGDGKATPIFWDLYTI